MYDYEEVDFETYCKICEYSDTPDMNDPCFDCLDEPVNLYSRKPISFKEK